MSKELKIATVFSGIGAFEQALNKLGIKYEIEFACDNGEREIKESYDEIVEYCKENKFKDSQTQNYVKSLYNKTKKINYVKESYFANYQIDENNWYEDIRFIDGNKYRNNIDIFVGGSPCQSFSIIGKRKGLDDARGTLFYNYANLVKEIQPKVFIYENVPGLLTHDNGKTWEIISGIFNSLEYDIHMKVLNSLSYGIPQNRKRLFVVGFKHNSNKFSFPIERELSTNACDYLEPQVAPHFYLGKKGFEFVTNPKYHCRARINSRVIQTQKANQQYNWNGDFVFEELNSKIHNKEILSRAFVGSWKEKKGVIRQMSYRECYRLMGFPDTYKIVVPNIQAYRQAGNSIVVDVLESILKEILKVDF